MIEYAFGLLLLVLMVRVILLAEKGSK